MLLEEKQKVQAGATSLKKRDPSPPVSSKITKIRTLFFCCSSCRRNGNGNLQNKGMILKLLFCYSESRCSDNAKEGSKLVT